LLPIGSGGASTLLADCCSMLSGVIISRTRLLGPSRTATKNRDERRASWGGRLSKEEANWGHVRSSRMWRRGENHAQSLVFAVVCSGGFSGLQRSRTGASCERECFRAMGGEYGFLRHNDLLSDGAEAGGRKA